jgi:hypothetical protein
MVNCPSPPTTYSCGCPEIPLSECVLIEDGGKRKKAIEKSKLPICQHCPYRNMDLSTYFERIYCVNLNRRPDRWERFESQIPQPWPFASVQRVAAIDGKKVKHPAYWRQGGGAWGCFRSHFRLIEQCLNEGVKSVLLMEDDAVFGPDFLEKCEQFLRHVPANWDMIYLGGQHLKINQNPPLKVNEWVYKPFNVNRTHAFALRGRMLRVVYHHLLTQDWHKGHHIDHHLGRLHQRRKHNIFCPKEWLIGQDEGKSNISGRTPPQRFWKPAEEIAAIDPETLPFVAVIGLHSSGSSCLAGVLYHLGLHLGNELGGYYGSNPDKSCGFEPVGLAQLCEEAIPFPSTDYAMKRGQRWGKLKRWINEKRREAHKRKTIAAAKYPQLCRFENQLVNICGDKLRLVHINRPIEDSIKSLQRRFPKKDPEKIAAHQRWLWEGKQRLLSRVPDHCTIEYHDLLENPAREVDRLISFLDLSPRESQIAKAIEYVDPKKRHV